MIWKYSGPVGCPSLVGEPSGPSAIKRGWLRGSSGARTQELNVLKKMCPGSQEGEKASFVCLSLASLCLPPGQRATGPKCGLPNAPDRLPRTCSSQGVRCGCCSGPTAGSKSAPRTATWRKSEVAPTNRLPASKGQCVLLEPEELTGDDGKDTSFAELPPFLASGGRFLLNSACYICASFPLFPLVSFQTEPSRPGANS